MPPNYLGYIKSAQISFVWKSLNKEDATKNIRSEIKSKREIFYIFSGIWNRFRVLCHCLIYVLQHHFRTYCRRLRPFHHRFQPIYTSFLGMNIPPALIFIYFFSYLLLIYILFSIFNILWGKNMLFSSYFYTLISISRSDLKRLWIFIKL